MPFEEIDDPWSFKMKISVTLWCGNCVAIPWGKHVSKRSNDQNNFAIPSVMKTWSFQSGFPEWIAGLTPNRNQTPKKTLKQGIVSLKAYKKRQPWIMIKMTKAKTPIQMTIAKIAMLNTRTKQDNQITEQSKQSVFLHCSNISPYPTMPENTWPHHAWLSHDRRWKSSLSREAKLFLEKMTHEGRNMWFNKGTWFGFLKVTVWFPQIEAQLSPEKHICGSKRGHFEKTGL